jgi:ABC-type spermidine/putrescine transport system permease subunit II
MSCVLMHVVPRAVSCVFFLIFFMSCRVVSKIDREAARYGYGTARIRHVVPTVPTMLIFKKIRYGTIKINILLQ